MARRQGHEAFPADLQAEGVDRLHRMLNEGSLPKHDLEAMGLRDDARSRKHVEEVVRLRSHSDAKSLEELLHPPAEAPREVPDIYRRRPRWPVGVLHRVAPRCASGVVQPSA